MKGSFIFLSDIELPFQNGPFLNQCIAIAKAYGVRQAVWGGDLFHLEAFSPFPGADVDGGEEITEIDEYLPGLLEPFERVYYFVGNHDDRAMRVLERKIKFEQMLRLFVSSKNNARFEERVTVSPYYWMLADHNWQLEHANGSGCMPASTAKGLAEKFRKNIVQGHTHKWGIVPDVSGRLVCIESGCCADVERLPYVGQRHSKGTAAVNGAVLMLDTGTAYQPMLLNPLVTDFEWLRNHVSRKH